MAIRIGRPGLVILSAAWIAVFFAASGLRALADCAAFGLPFADLGSTSFCAEIAEAYFSGLSNGTSATTYAPSQNVPREQMAAFVTRTLDQSLLRGNRRAALDQWWSSSPHFDQTLATTTVGTSPTLLKSDGADVWVANFGNATVSRVRASDGRLLQTWTSATKAYGVLVAMGRVFVTANQATGTLYLINPSAASGAAVTVATASLGAFPGAIAFDGNKIWTANSNNGLGGGSVSIVVPGTWTVTNVTTGFHEPIGLVFDGVHMWVTDATATGTVLRKLDANGAVLQSVALGFGAGLPAFDGRNIWVPQSFDDTLSVVRVSDGVVLKTFPANSNGMDEPSQAAFDGQRIAVTNESAVNGTPSLSLFKATDLSAIGNFPLAGVTLPFGVCSDGVNFWVALGGSAEVGRF